jgi:orotate phosphoribosyltransferase
VVVLLDREQGGKKHITAKGYTLHAVMTLSQLLSELEATGKINKETADMVRAFIQNNQT